MTIREQLEASRPGNPPLAGENATDIILELPSCTIEDIDRAIFELFDKSMPLTYSYKKEPKKIPVVFAAGERFALIARKKPLRDKAGALILPVISIMRSGLSQDNEMGLSSNSISPHIIKRRLSKKDPRYQQWLNKMGLKNSDDLATDEAFLNSGGGQPTGGAPLSGAKAGRIATRRSGSPSNSKIREGNLLDASKNNNIYEVIEMPPPAFVTATYEITVWAQYVVQMNDIIMTIMTNAQNYDQRTFRIESQKGYTFVAYMESGFDPSNNFEDFSDDERIIKTSFTMKVPGYLLGETYPGSPSRLRSVLSSPQLSFEMDFVSLQILDAIEVGIPSGNPADYGDDDRHVHAPLPGQAIAGQSSISKSDPRTPGRLSSDKNDSAMIGGAVNDIRENTVEKIIDPFTGKTIRKIGVVKTRTNRSGETIYREIF